MLEIDTCKSLLNTGLVMFFRAVWLYQSMLLSAIFRSCVREFQSPGHVILYQLVHLCQVSIRICDGIDQLCKYLADSKQ